MVIFIGKCKGSECIERKIVKIVKVKGRNTYIMDKIKVKIENMETTNTDNALKPALSSTKSIDEGFESDPDRELSNAESDSNHLQPSSVVVQAQTFDVLQRTDRDGVQYTQIARRPLHTDFPGHKPFESGTILSAGENLRRSKELEKNRIVYTNSKVSIPRAGAANQRIIMTTNGSIQSTQLAHLTPNHLQYTASTIGNNTMIVDQHNHRHRLADKSLELGNSRLAKSTELMLRSGNTGRDRMNFPTTMNDNLSQVALINGKLICVNMPVTQIIPAASIPSASASSLANATHNHIFHNSKRHFSNSSNSNTAGTGNQATKISNNHHQKYISNGRNSNTNSSNSNNTNSSNIVVNDVNSIAQQVNNAIIENANSSIHTFYPAEGNISLIQSQYGLKYKSTHLNRIQEQPAPISLWSQSLARQPRR